MNEPLKYQFTEKELADLAQSWMRVHYADLKDRDPDAFYSRFGMIYDFITDVTRNRQAYEKP